jgi:endonuclease YncB( thermonuclease family)
MRASLQRFKGRICLHVSFTGPAHLANTEGEVNVAKFQAFLRPLMIFQIALALVPFAASAAEVVGQASVTDGDTLTIGTTKVRLHGIDAPESGQLCQGASGQDYDCSGVATRALRAMVKDWTISCKAKDTDQYGRTVAVCHVGQLDLGARMVELGHALAFRHYAFDYVAQEDQARVAKRGMWSGAFQPAWEWRAAQRARTDQQASTQTAPKAGCTIKGNIDRKGAHIHHVEGSRDYARTQINTASGERWFCFETEARAAGWRAASEQ